MGGRGKKEQQKESGEKEGIKEEGRGERGKENSSRGRKRGMGELGRGYREGGVQRYRGTDRNREGEKFEKIKGKSG